MLNTAAAILFGFFISLMIVAWAIPLKPKKRYTCGKDGCNECH